MTSEPINSPATSLRRSGFTLIELLVVIAIISMLAGLLLPAVQRARESGRRAHCLNNLHQIGLGLQLHAEQRNAFPVSGAGIDELGDDAFALQSMFTSILPFLEMSTVHNKFELQYAYNDPASPDNKQAAKTVIPFFLCVSNAARPQNGRDALGYGYTDYMPVSYVDIDAAGVAGTPVRNPVPPNLTAGALRYKGTTTAHYRDGMSSTIVVTEDSGRSESFFSAKYDDPLGVDLLPPSGTKRASWRWAEPASAGGISGPPGATFGDPRLKMVNNTGSRIGGPPGCPWTTTNCGANEEPYSFHGGGVNTLYMDSHISFLRDDIDPIVLRRLLTPLEGLPPADIAGNSFADY